MEAWKICIGVLRHCSYTQYVTAYRNRTYEVTNNSVKAWKSVVTNWCGVFSPKEVTASDNIHFSKPCSLEDIAGVAGKRIQALELCTQLYMLLLYIFVLTTLLLWPAACGS